MLSRFLPTILFASLLSAQAWAIDEGIDYTELSVPQPTESGDKIEVLEVFMYSCPHCYHLEPNIEKWLATKPENVELRRMPAVFGPKVEPHARAFYAAELVDAADKFSLAMFEALHVSKRGIWEEDDLVKLAESVGIDGAEFRKAYNSFFVRMRVNRAKEMGKRYGIDGVPAFIVNGKYRTSPSQTGGRDKAIQVIDHLIKLESRQVTSPGSQSAPESTTEAIPESAPEATTESVSEPTPESAAGGT